MSDSSAGGAAGTGQQGVTGGGEGPGGAGQPESAADRGSQLSAVLNTLRDAAAAHDGKALPMALPQTGPVQTTEDGRAAVSAAAPRR